LKIGVADKNVRPTGAWCGQLSAGIVGGVALLFGLIDEEFPVANSSRTWD
jgi:hypothetical protein